MSFTLPAGYFPQLPDTVCGEDESGLTYHVGGTSGTGITGILGHVFRVVDGAHEDVVRNVQCSSSDAWKAHCLARGWTVPWRYGARALHPKARDYS